MSSEPIKPVEDGVKVETTSETPTPIVPVTSDVPPASQTKESKSITPVTPEVNQGLVDAKAKATSNPPTPVVVANPTVVTKPVADSPKIKLVKECAAIQKEYEGESNIPVGHRYWDLCNQIRQMK